MKKKKKWKCKKKKCSAWKGGKCNCHNWRVYAPGDSISTPLQAILKGVKSILWLSLVVFAQVIMLCGSQHYISLIDRSIKNTGVTGTSKHHSFRKRSSRLERGKHMPLYFVFYWCSDTLKYQKHNFTFINLLLFMIFN